MITFEQGIRKNTKQTALHIRIYIVMEELYRKFYNTKIKPKKLDNKIFIFPKNQEEYNLAEEVVGMIDDRGTTIVLGDPLNG